MHYNTRIINYPNGEIQIRKYSEIMFLKDIPFDEPNKLLKFQTAYENKQLTNPFDGKVTREIFDFETFESDQLKNKFRSWNRMKQKIFSFSRCCEWEYFITLTFDPKKIDSMDFSVCSKFVRKWLNNQKNRFAPNLKYLIVPEQHKLGGWHFHGLLADTGSIVFTDSLHKTKSGDIIYNMSKYTYGFTTATKVKDIHKVGKYICKYITKSLTDTLVGKHRYFASSNIPLPTSIILFLEDDEFNDYLSMFSDSVGKGVVRISETGDDKSFTKVKYVELV